MGAVGITLSIEPARAPPGKKRATPIALHRALTRSIMERIARMHWGTVYGRTAVSYLGDEVADGYAKPRFAASEEHLVWTFGDKAGLCGGSASLCLHIWELVLSRRREGLDELAARRGWRITSPAVSSHVMALATPYPTVGFEGHALCVPPFVFGALDWEPGLGPFFDEGSPRPTLDELSRDRRSRFVRAATAGTCGCPPCGTIPLERFNTPLSVLEKSWVRIGEHDALQALCRRVCDELPIDWVPNVAPGALGELKDALRTKRITIRDTAGLAFRAMDAMRRRGEP